MDFDTQAQPGMSMPFSLEAEQSVLGAVLLEPSCLSTVVDILPRAEYFYAVNNRMIYAAMMEMFALGQPVDFVTVLERLKEEKDFDEATGKVYLTQLAQLVPAISHVESYARIVRDKYELRTLMQAARGILSDASAGEQETSLLLDSAEKRIYDIRRGKSDEGLQPVREILLETFDRLDKLNSADRDKYKGLPTGIKELDNTITGLNRSDLIVLGARLIEAGDILRRADLYFDDSPGLTVLEMKGKLRRLDHVDLVIVDYLQLMTGTKRTDNRVNEISEITRNLKVMAKELNVPVMALSQLRRPTERTKDHRPGLSELRDSGSIEQDADIVIFLHREAYNATSEGGQVTEDMDQNAAEIIVAKNRHGETKPIPVHWQGEYMRYTSREVIRHE